MKTDSKSSMGQDKPSLDQLFAVKKAERPDAEYWQAFEMRLRQRQLAAMIEPAPWWYGAALYLSRASVKKFIIPVTASACLAVFLTLSSSKVDFAGGMASRVALQPVPGSAAGSESRPSDTLSRQMASLGSAKPDLLQHVETIPTNALPDLSTASLASDLADTGTVFAAKSVTTLAQGRPAGVPSKDVAVLGEGADTETNGPAYPTAFSQTATVLNTTGFSVSGVMVANSGTASAAEESLASLNFDEAWQEGVAASPQVDTMPLNPRQARLLATVDDLAGTSPTKALAHVRERVVHRLEASEELYASASRVGVSADRLSLKF